MIPPGIQLCLKNKTFQVSHGATHSPIYTPLVKKTHAVRASDAVSRNTRRDEVVAGDVFIWDETARMHTDSTFESSMDQVGPFAVTPLPTYDNSPFSFFW